MELSLPAKMIIKATWCQKFELSLPAKMSISNMMLSQNFGLSLSEVRGLIRSNTGIR